MEVVLLILMIFPPLICKDGSSVVSWARKVVSFYSLLSGAKQIGRKLSTGVYCNIALGSHCTNEELIVLAMVGEKFGLQRLDLLPSGVSLPLWHVSWATIMHQMYKNFECGLPTNAGI
jgi:anaphase-promoting complex subunit 1